MSFLRMGCFCVYANWKNKDLFLINRTKWTASSSASIWPSAQEAKQITHFLQISNELCFVGCEMTWYPLGRIHRCVPLCVWGCVCACIKRQSFTYSVKTKKHFREVIITWTLACSQWQQRELGSCNMLEKACFERLEKVLKIHSPVCQS